jgi:hypothetical protein
MPQAIEQREKRVPTHEQIGERAYQIYLARGGQPGHEMDDWLQAEYELMQLPIHKIAELGPPQSPRQDNRRRMLRGSALVALVQVGLALAAARLR